jgi:hypothetical protein
MSTLGRKSLVGPNVIAQVVTGLKPILMKRVTLDFCALCRFTFDVDHSNIYKAKEAPTKSIDG